MSLEFDCKQTVEMVSKELDVQLTEDEKKGMEEHLLECSYCRTYQDQLTHIEKYLRKRVTFDAQLVSLSDGAKARILKKIEEM